MQQQQNNMITSLDKIPMKSPANVSNNDDLSDPIVKNVLDEFEQELLMQQKPKYNIHDTPQQPQQQFQPQYRPSPQPQKITKCYIDNELITKAFIICIVMAIITNPYIYDTLITKMPDNISVILDSYNYIIKIILLFVAIYGLMFYNLI
jgi:hypothetical protein